MDPILRTGSLLLLSACLLMTCTTSPLNRRQMLIFSEAEMAQQGEQTYRQLQQELPISADTRETQYIQCIADYVVAAMAMLPS